MSRAAELAPSTRPLAPLGIWVVTALLGFLGAIAIGDWHPALAPLSDRTRCRPHPRRQR